MKWIETRVVIEPGDVAVISEAVADVFFECGLDGVVIEDGKLDSSLDWGEDAVKVSDIPSVIGYFSETASLTSHLEKLEFRIEELSRRTHRLLKVEYRKIDDEDWAECWKEYFWPVQVTDNIIVKPTWREYPAKPSDIIIQIDPGMAFGTGSHATTSLCVRMIQKYIGENCHFLDIGTGSGILMIAAALLKAKYIVGVDRDEMATAVARQNLMLNGISQEKCMVVTGSLIESVGGTFDLVVANIISEIIDRLLEDLARVIRPDGYFIASGIIDDNKLKIISRMRAEGFDVIDVAEKDSWVAIVARR